MEKIFLSALLLMFVSAVWLHIRDVGAMSHVEVFLVGWVAALAPPITAISGLIYIWTEL